MQPVEAQTGLGSIIECVKAGTHNREVLYLCEVCVCRLSKADMRNHIMGSLHRYNYIKAWYPHLLSEWKEKSDLSKLAWPLMDMAKILEGKEGPGDIQWLDLEDAVYQTIATLRENDAVTLITIFRELQGKAESHSETPSVQLEHHSTQSQRVVLLSEDQQRQSKNSLETSAVPETKQTVAFVAEHTVLSENSCLDGYTGSNPLIGLFRVVECRSEDGRTYCFLCHCCRIRANEKDIIDHLTRSSHIVNYLMETHPEQVEVMMADINDNYKLLQSLARKVEQEEGRGELKVVNAPESLGIQLTGKSYHWCVKMLCNGWTCTNTQKQKIAVKGPNVNKTSDRGMPEKCAGLLSQWPKRMTAKRKMTNPVFKVSLPLSKGAMLLERSSFSVDSIPLSSAYSPSSDSDLPESPELQSEDCELDYDTGSFENTRAEQSSQLQQDVYSGDAEADQYMEAEGHGTVTPYLEVDEYFNDYEYVNHLEDITGTKYQKVYGGNYYNGQHGSQVRSSKRLYKE
ncbi:uncharacterized protein LOC115015315 isoform X2 [Cottoperca gobio]|uniref:Uncharacterized protein LOC115015315 isoform X2 n=1 Tax=Cottoperca gobio TaxID=56716 RepID=A0A6J2QKA7_COTGO|nr:uncharacterized protein LOC115015315 isoform X2 [Cottoperca gobio]